MQFLLTRPYDDNIRLAQSLMAFGHQVMLEPLLTIKYYPPQPIDPTGIQALLFTSANGVRAFIQNSSDRDISSFCVGASTAEQAHQAGFSHISTAGGNGGHLFELVRETLDPKGGKLMHICGKDVAGDLATRLETCGFQVIKKALYQAEKATSLSEETCQMIRKDQISHMPLYSPRTAQTFVQLIQKAGLTEKLSKISALCLSPAVADMISSLPWGKILIAKHPDSSHLFQLIDIKLEENR